MQLVLYWPFALRRIGEQWAETKARYSTEERKLSLIRITKLTGFKNISNQRKVTTGILSVNVNQSMWLQCWTQQLSTKPKDWTAPENHCEGSQDLLFHPSYVQSKLETWQALSLQHLLRMMIWRQFWTLTDVNMGLIQWDNAFFLTWQRFHCQWQFFPNYSDTVGDRICIHKESE